MKTGKLYRNGKGTRWLIVYATKPLDYYELTSGDLLDVKVGGKWITTSIEFGAGDYYATAPGIQLCNDLEARLTDV